MLFNYLKVAFRHLWKNKGFSLINIIGLSLGLAATMLILLWVGDERKMDTFSRDPHRVYQVFTRTTANGEAKGGTSTPGLLAQELKRRIPQVEAATGYGWTAPGNFSVGGRSIQEPTNFADSDFFHLFSYPLLEGNARTALADPLSMAISRNMAQTLFGSPAAAIGKTIRYEDRKDFTVKAVFENLGPQVSDHFDCLLNWTFFLQDNAWLKQWGNSGPATYLLLKPGSDTALVHKNIASFLDAYVGKDQHYKRELDLQLYADHYLYGNLESGYAEGGRIEYVRLFSIIAFFVLFIACINFMNLTTGRSMRRAREIGIRKVMGAVRAWLILQFFGEAMIVALLSLGLALALVGVSLPAFNGFTGKQIVLPYGSVTFALGLVALTVVTGMLSGSYPALYLSRFQPVVVLKGTLGPVKAALLRRGLVVFQFVLSIILITGALIVSRQIDYIRHKDLGYDRENLLYVPLSGNLVTHFATLRSETLALPGVAGVTGTSDNPTNVGNGSSDLAWAGKDPQFVPSIAVLTATYDLIPTLKLRLAAGRDFAKDMATDSNAYLINESAAAMMGMKQAVGQRISFWNHWGTIIGVVKDFHFQSLHDAIRPLIFRPGAAEEMGLLLVRIRPGETRAVLDGLAKVCKAMNPNFPFTYQFSDEEFTKLYKSDEVIGTLSTFFALLAIVISCLGLLGLSFFAIEQRTREIGIRKILGARVGGLFVLLSAEFLVLIGIAFLIATPLAWWVMRQWLKGYAYQAPIGWGIFALSGAAALVMALGTVSFQAWKAANGNPTRSLRTE
jgi:putative ABC transport system permease protein